MAKRKMLCVFLCVLLSLAWVGLISKPTQNAYGDEPIEVYDVSFQTNGVGAIFSGMFLNVLIPPDAHVNSFTLVSTGEKIDNATLTYAGCFSLRCYRFAQAKLVFDSTSGGDDTINVTVRVSRNAVQYVPCSGDELADTIMQRLKECPFSGNTLPTSAYGNLNNSDLWRGYPVLPVNKASSYQLPQEKVDYLVIADGYKFPVLYDLLVLKSQQGLHTFFMFTQDIASNYVGDSIQYKTLEFLKDAFNTWHMPYVLLVGNTGTLPPIAYTVYNVSMGGIPFDDHRICDYYYSTLEQPADTFSYEYRDCVDFPDFVLGRFPFDDASQISNLVNKTIDYETNDDPGDWVRTNLIVAGKDAPGSPIWQCENYTTDRPKNYLLYEEGNLSIQSLADEINKGEAGTILILTHGSSDGFYIGNGKSFSYNNVGLLNNSRLPVIFTIGCHTGAFNAGGDGSQSVAVSLLAKQNSGAVTIVSGTSFTPYGHWVYFSAYNYWNATPVIRWRIPDANYSIGKAFYFFTALNSVVHMILLGDPAQRVATANYDAPSPPATPVPAPTPRPTPAPTPTPTSTPTPTQSSQSTTSSTPNPTPTPAPTPTPEPAPTSIVPQTTPSDFSDSTPFWSPEAICITITITTSVVIIGALSLKKLRKTQKQKLKTDA